MSTGDNSYYRLLFSIRERMNYDSVYDNAMDELSGKVDVSWVKSCVSIGTGDGRREFQFAKLFLPNLQTFVSVDPDHESVMAFRANIQEGQLPGVEATALETTIREWSGVEKPVDLVLMFDVLVHVERADRQSLFQKLFTQYLAPNGIVGIITACIGPTTGFYRLMERLGKPATVYYDEVEKEMLAAGFNLLYIQDITGPDDLSNPCDDLVKYVQLFADNVPSEQEVRSAIDEIFGSIKSHFLKKMAFFKKSHG